MNEVQVVPAGITPEQEALIMRTVAPGLDKDEFALFMHYCRERNLDPLTKQVYAIKRRDKNSPTGHKMTVQTSIDGFRVIAARTGQMAGSDDAVFVTGKNGQLESATVTVYRLTGGHRCPYTATARWKEYVQEYNGSPMGLWAKMPHVMLAKCAETQALRKAFPEALSGIYGDEEMAQADVIDHAPATPEPPKQVEAPKQADPAPGTPEWQERVEKAMKMLEVPLEHTEAITDAIAKRSGAASVLTELRAAYADGHRGIRVIARAAGVPAADNSVVPSYLEVYGSDALATMAEHVKSGKVYNVCNGRLGDPVEEIKQEDMA